MTKAEAFWGGLRLIGLLIELVFVCYNLYLCYEWFKLVTGQMTYRDMDTPKLVALTFIVLAIWGIAWWLALPDVRAAQ